MTAQSEIETVSDTKPSGPAAAAFIAAGIGALVMGIMVNLNELSGRIKELLGFDTSNFLRFDQNFGLGSGVGPLSGKVIISVLAYLVAWGVLAYLWRGREISVRKTFIWTLVLAADLYQRGFAFGLILPFVLGVGMGLPWPIAGAGLAFLPKPGRWMEFVKYAFGVIILGFAVWYGLLGMSILRSRSADRKAEVAAAQRTTAGQGGWAASLEDALAKARSEGKEVFIDFWASWCKNCLAMDRTTFRDEAVVRRLKKYVRVKYQAEDLRDPGVRAVLDHFGVVGGLPTYVILRPSPAGKGAAP